MAHNRSLDETQLLKAQDLFIGRWGEMGQTWGINRTMAEIHALLYIAVEPLCMDQVMQRLNISRGNASMSLRALCDWGVIRKVSRPGRRRQFYESLPDVWELFSIIISERKRREMDPALETIRQCRAMLSGAKGQKTPATIAAALARLGEMEQFMEVTNAIFQQFIGNNGAGLTQVASVLLQSSGREG